MYGLGFMYGGPSIPLLFALDFVRVHGKKPGELRPDEGFLDREDMIVQMSIATNFAW